MHHLFSAEIVDIADIAQDTKKFSFRIVENAPKPFFPGQFFLLSLENNINRAYSIASSPSALPFFDLLIKRVPNGAATDGFLWKASVGDHLSFRGPMGRFTLRHPEKKHIFIATGTGLAPMRSFWQFLLEQGSPPPVHLVFGVRDEDHLFCEQELAELSQKYSSFSYTICLSRPHHPHNTYVSGRVTDYCASLPPSAFADADVFLCGSRGMVEDMKAILTEKGVQKEHIGIESW